MSKATVKDVDRGAKRLLALIKDANKKALVVGVFGDKALTAAQGGSGLTVGEVAAAHEFAIPAGQPRSWLRSTLDENASSIASGMGKLYKKVVDGKMTPEEALNLTGLAVVGKIQQRIATGIPPELSPEYLPRKLAEYPGKTTPLEASGQFRGSITAAVVDAEALK